MRILYIIHETNPFSGSSKSFLTLIEQMQNNGVEVMVVAPDNKGIYETLMHKNIRSAYISTHYYLAVYPPVKSFKDRLAYIPRLIRDIATKRVATYKLNKIIKKFQPDIIHSNSSMIDIGYIACKQHNIPHVWHIREYGDKDFGFKFYPSKATRHKRFLESNVYPISITKDIYNHNNLSYNSNARVIYNGILSKDDTVFIKEKEPYFLFAGCLFKTKGVEELILAYDQFVKQNSQSSINLYIAGKGEEDYATLLKKNVADLRLESRVKFLGARNDILSLMSKAMAVIVPSYTEGFGRITPEAMFNGALVIGRNTAGTKEQFDNGLTLIGEDIALRFKSQAELVECINKVASEGITNFDQMIIQSQKVVSELYSTEQYFNNIHNIYKQIVSR